MPSGKRRVFDPRQQVLVFDQSPASPEPAAPRDGQLEGLERRVSLAVARILADCQRAGLSRYQIASEVSELMADEVTKAMLDAYASESKDTHNISFARFLALVAGTGAFEVLGSLMAEIGVGVVLAEEVHTVELGHIQAQMRELEQRKQQLLKVVKPIKNRGGK